MGFGSILQRLKGYAQSRLHENRAGLKNFIQKEVGRGVDQGFDTVTGKGQKPPAPKKEKKKPTTGKKNKKK